MWCTNLLLTIYYSEREESSVTCDSEIMHYSSGKHLFMYLNWCTVGWEYFAVK